MPAQHLPRRRPGHHGGGDEGLSSQPCGFRTHHARQLDPHVTTNGDKQQRERATEQRQQQNHQQQEWQCREHVEQTHQQSLQSPAEIAGHRSPAQADQQRHRRGQQADQQRQTETEKAAHEDVATNGIRAEPVTTGQRRRLQHRIPVRRFRIERRQPGRHQRQHDQRRQRQQRPAQVGRQAGKASRQGRVGHVAIIGQR